MHMHIIYSFLKVSGSIICLLFSPSVFTQLVQSQLSYSFKSKSLLFNVHLLSSLSLFTSLPGTLLSYLTQNLLEILRSIYYYCIGPEYSTKWMTLTHFLWVKMGYICNLQTMTFENVLLTFMDREQTKCQIWSDKNNPETS